MDGIYGVDMRDNISNGKVEESYFTSPRETLSQEWDKEGEEDKVYFFEGGKCIV